MHIPQLLQTNADHIRELTPNVREVHFDKEHWRRTLRDYRWEVLDNDIPRIDEIINAIPQEVLTHGLIKGNTPWIPCKAPDGRLGDEQARALERLFVLVMIWTYGEDPNGPAQAARILNHDETRSEMFRISENIYYGDICGAYIVVNRFSKGVKWSFCSNLLYFLSSGIPPKFVKALMFEDAIAQALRGGDPEFLNYGSELAERNIARENWGEYAQYLMLVHNWAEYLRCGPEQIVEFLRLKGLGIG